MSLQALAARSVPENHFDESELHQDFRDLKWSALERNPLAGRISEYVVVLVLFFDDQPGIAAENADETEENNGEARQWTRSRSALERRAPVVLNNVIKHLSFYKRPTRTILHGSNVKEIRDILHIIPEELRAPFVNLKDHDGGTALHKAVERDNLDAVRTLLAEIPKTQRMDVLLETDRTGKTALSIASVRDNLSIVQELVKHGSITEKARDIEVIRAAKLGHVNILQELLKSGPVSEEARGKAVVQAAKSRYFDVVQELLRNGPIPQKSRERAISDAVSFGRLDDVQELLRDGPISEEVRGREATRAATLGRLAIVQELLRSGNTSDKARGQALREAAYRNNLEIVQELLKDNHVSRQDHVLGAIAAGMNGHFTLAASLFADKKVLLSVLKRHVRLFLYLLL